MTADFPRAIFDDAQVGFELIAFSERLAREIGALAGDPLDALCIRGPRRSCGAVYHRGHWAAGRDLEDGKLGE